MKEAHDDPHDLAYLLSKPVEERAATVTYIIFPIINKRTKNG